MLLKWEVSFYMPKNINWTLFITFLIGLILVGSNIDKWRFIFCRQGCLIRAIPPSKTKVNLQRAFFLFSFLLELIYSSPAYLHPSPRDLCVLSFKGKRAIGTQLSSNRRQKKCFEGSVWYIRLDNVKNLILVC